MAFFEANTSTLIEISADVLNSEHLDKAKRNVITYLNGKKVLISKVCMMNWCKAKKKNSKKTGCF